MGGICGGFKSVAFDVLVGCNDEAALEVIVRVVDNFTEDGVECAVESGRMVDVCEVKMVRRVDTDRTDDRPRGAEADEATRINVVRRVEAEPTSLKTGTKATERMLEAIELV